MFQRAGYYGRAAAAGADNVPDGVAALAPGEWSLNNTVRSVGGAELNPPLVTLTEDTANITHGAYQPGAPSIGPYIRTKIYFQAGSRRYVNFSPSVNGGAEYVSVCVDTVNWVITGNTAGGGASLVSATLEDVGNGDWLLTIFCSTPSSASASWSVIAGGTTGTAARAPAYVGDGVSTMVIRRWDFDAPPMPPPTLGAGTVTVAATTGTTLTGTTQHTPAAGVTSAVIRYICRNTVTTSHNPIAATFQGKTVVFPSGSQASNISTASKAHVGVGYVTGLTNTAGSLVITSNRSMGGLVARIDDVSYLDASRIGAAAAISSVTSSASPAISGTMQAAGSLVLAMAGAVNGGADPFSLSPGWTEQAEGQSGTAATDVVAVFGTKTGGAAATVETMTATGALATTAWGGVMLEVKT